MPPAPASTSGGWQIIKTLGHKRVKLHPSHGFAAETSSATIPTVAAHFGMPVSTTHSISTAIIGVGFAKNPKALKFSVIERWAGLDDFVGLMRLQERPMGASFLVLGCGEGEARGHGPLLRVQVVC